MLFSQKQKGFTLIELLVVVAIIGVLATVVLANLSKARARAKFIQADVVINNRIPTKLQFYLADNPEPLRRSWQYGIGEDDPVPADGFCAFIVDELNVLYNTPVNHESWCIEYENGDIEIDVYHENLDGCRMRMNFNGEVMYENAWTNEPLPFCKLGDFE